MENKNGNEEKPAASKKQQRETNEEIQDDGNTQVTEEPDIPCRLFAFLSTCTDDPRATNRTIDMTQIPIHRPETYIVVAPVSACGFQDPFTRHVFLVPASSSSSDPE